IGYIHPDIIKVDINIMRESLNRNSFRQVLNAISEMSLKLGSELLFEGIETEEELTLALSMGSSLLQGFYFSKATKEFQNKSQFSKNLKVILEKFSGLRFLELVQNCQKEQAIIDSLSEIFDGIHDVKEDALYEPVFQTLKVLPPEIKSVIVCDLHGYQLSPTFERKDTGDWKEIVSDIGNNFAWKPYFIQHKAERYHYHKKWGVTDQLYDIQSQKKYVIFTFSLSETIVLMARIDWV
ncbi:MAG: EAL domain-containing protein, partial [Leptospira sp.]|nr:EAL domain-containing protein [Leptospira sp.]